MTPVKKAVIIDFEQWGELWEDFYDVLVSESGKNELTVPRSELMNVLHRRNE